MKTNPTPVTASCQEKPDNSPTPRSGVPDAEYWKAHYEAALAAAREDSERLLSALTRWKHEWDLCSQEQREVGHSEMNITVKLVLDTNAAIDAARARKEGV